MFDVLHFVSLYVPHFVVAQIYNKTDRHDTDVYRHETDCIQTAFDTLGVPVNIVVPKGRPFETRVRFYEPE